MLRAQLIKFVQLNGGRVVLDCEQEKPLSFKSRWLGEKLKDNWLAATGSVIGQL
jgi:hypothetical protein